MRPEQLKRFVQRMTDRQINDEIEMARFGGAWWKLLHDEAWFRMRAEVGDLGFWEYRYD